MAKKPVDKKAAKKSVAKKPGPAKGAKKAAPKKTLAAYQKDIKAKQKKALAPVKKKAAVKVAAVKAEPKKRAPKKAQLTLVAKKRGRPKKADLPPAGTIVPPPPTPAPEATPFVEPVAAGATPAPNFVDSLMVETISVPVPAAEPTVDLGDAAPEVDSKDAPAEEGVPVAAKPADDGANRNDF